MTQIIVESGNTAQWQKLVHEAEALCEYQLDEELESYLVFLLIRFLDKADFTSRIMALDYLNSLVETGKLRESKLREVGDHCLLFSGLFPKIAEKRRIKVSYYVSLGQSAYNDLATTCQLKLGDLYYQLANSFVKLMDILQTIGSMRDASNVLSPLQAFELWSETRSQKALDALKRSTSVISTPSLVHSSKKH